VQILRRTFLKLIAIVPAVLTSRFPDLVISDGLPNQALESVQPEADMSEFMCSPQYGFEFRSCMAREQGVELGFDPESYYFFLTERGWLYPESMPPDNEIIERWHCDVFAATHEFREQYRISCRSAHANWSRASRDALRVEYPVPQLLLNRLVHIRIGQPI